MLAVGSIRDWYVAISGAVSGARMFGINCTDLIADWVVFTLLSWEVVL